MYLWTSQNITLLEKHKRKSSPAFSFLGFPPRSSQSSLLTTWHRESRGTSVYKRRKTTAVTIPFIIILTLVLLLYLAKFFHVHLTIQLCLGNRGRQNYSPSLHIGASLVVLTVKTACNGSGICPGEGNGNPSSILAWRIPRTEEPGGLQSVESQRVRHN